MARILLILQTISCSITLLYGFVMFAWFLFAHHNYNSSIWALLLAISSGPIVHLNLLIFKRKILNWYDQQSFKAFMVFGLILTIVAVIASSVYLYLAISKKEKFSLFTYYATALLALMTIKGSLSLFFVSRRYIRKMESGSIIDLPSSLTTNGQKNSADEDRYDSANSHGP